MDFVETQASTYEDLAPQYHQFGELYQQKLWHQLTESLLEFVQNPQNQRGDNLIRLYNEFISTFSDRISQLQLVRIATYVAQQYYPSKPYVQSELDRAIDFMVALAIQRDHIGEDSYLVAAMEIASLQLKKGSADAAPVNLPERPKSENEEAQAGHSCDPGEHQPEESVEQDEDVSMTRNVAKESSTEPEKQLSGTDYCRVALEKEATTLRSLKGSGTDPVVPATYYRVASEYYKIRGPAGAYFGNAMQYLVNTPISSLPEEQRHAWAVDVALSALVAQQVFSFGELVSHPILASLDGTSESWLGEILHAFQHGDIQAFNSIVAKHRNEFESHPALAAAANVVKEKIVLLAVMELVSRRPPHKRVITFKEIAQATFLPLTQIEWMLMRGMSLGLLKGRIDQVEEKVSISFVKPRVLDMTQISRLHESVISWRQKLDGMRNSVEVGSEELFK